MGRRDEGFFSARDNTRLYWQSLMPDADFDDVIGIVHGFGDHSGRYRRVMEALVRDRHAVLAFDYRGHGKADGRRGHCGEFGEFLGDMEVFWARLRQLASGKPTFLLAHSHGALISTHFAVRRPEGLKGLVFTCPYFRTAKPPNGVALMAGRAVGKLWPTAAIPLGLKPEMFSHDQNWLKETDEDPLYGKKGTLSWVIAHMNAQEQLNGMGQQVTQPLLMITAGDDPVVSTAAAKGFFDTVASADKTYKEFPGMLHEVMAEIGKEDVWSEISRWISAHR